MDDCIKSVIYQEYDNLEIILINDGSQDNSERIINKWIAKDQRIKYIAQENKGVAYARNKGISIANGEYIFLLDADDYLERNALSKLVTYVETTKADIIIGNFIEKSGNSIVKKPGFETRLFNKQDLESLEVMLSMFVNNGRYMARAGNKLYKKEFINNNNIVFKDKVIAEDRLFNLMCYVNKPIIQIVDEYTYIYNKLDNSRSRTLSSTFYDESISIINYFYSYLKSKMSFQNYMELFQLNVLYDVQKLLNLTFEFSKQKNRTISHTIKELRKNKLVMDTISDVIKERKFRIIKGDKTFNRLLLINYLLIRFPLLIPIYKTIGYMTRGLRYKIVGNNF